VTRFLFGAGEAGCFPNLTKSFTTWLPAEERVRAQGIMWSFARWGGAFTPPLVILVFRWFDWRHAFLMFGFLGLVWCAFFWAWYKDNPREHKSVNAAEVELLKGAEATAAGHGDVPWERLLFSKTVWLLWLQYFLLAYPWYFYITWLPTYLQEHRGLDPERSSWAAIFPLLFGGFGSLFCGLISARVARWMGSVSLARRWLGSIGFFGAGTLIIVSIQVKDPFLAMMVMGLASFSNDLVMPGAWGACMDVGGKYAGTLSGSMNMMGNLAGFVAPATAGYLLQYTGNWNVPLYVMAGVYLFGTAIWPFIDPVTLLEKTRLMAYDSLFVICGVMQSIPLMFALVFRFRSENATLALAGGSILVAALSVAVSLSLGHIGRRYRGNPMYYRLYGVVGTAGGILVWLASSPLHTGYEIWLWAVISLTHLPWYLFLGYIARKRLGH
jgi:sugar phosphate permease